MRQPVTRLVLAVVTCLTVAACSSSPASEPPPTSASAPDSGGAPAESAHAPALPVADRFGPAKWGLLLPTSENPGPPPIVTSERVIFLEGERVRALGPDGKEVWTGTWNAFSADTRSGGASGYPFLRQVSPEVVAVVDGGRASGEGLDRDSHDVRVALFKIADGSLVKEVVLPGTEGNSPEPGEVGMGFYLPGDPQGTASVVLPDGEVKELPPVEGEGTEGAATIGNTALTITGDYGGASGFAGPGYDSASLAPSPKHTLGSVQASNADSWFVGRFVVPMGEPAYRVFDASSGDLLSEPNCDPVGADQIVMSPDRSWGVLGPMRLDKVGNATCFGGEGQRKVRLTAVTGDGRAFGLASQSGGDDVLVDVSATGDISTAPLPEGAAPPVGVMKDGLAIHFDAHTGTLTANPIKEG